MNKFIPLLLVFTLIACEEAQKPEAPKNYVTFSGKVTNGDLTSLDIRARDFTKTFDIGEDGTFSDTFSVEPGVFYLVSEPKGMLVFLKNGYDLSVTIDAEKFGDAVTFSGEGSKDNNYIVEKTRFETKLYDQDFSSLTINQLDSALKDIGTQIVSFIDSKEKEGIDSLLISEHKKEIPAIAESIKGYYAQIIQLKEAMPKGSPAPTFTDFENYDGTKTSLSDLKGKNVYIDVWATWCGPCKAEIPALKKLEHDYEGKNIAFVSLSVDDNQAHKGSWDLANQKWREMIKDKTLGGIQLLAPKGWETPFIRDFKINSIPRFILLDTEGNIIDPSAFRPSDEKLRTLLDEII